MHNGRQSPSGLYKGRFLSNQGLYMAYVCKNKGLDYIEGSQMFVSKLLTKWAPLWWTQPSPTCANPYAIRVQPCLEFGKKYVLCQLPSIASGLIYTALWLMLVEKSSVLCVEKTEYQKGILLYGWAGESLLTAKSWLFFYFHCWKFRSIDCPHCNVIGPKLALNKAF